MSKKGLIFNIQKFSIHDGPGIRTTVFFKGCPLSCWWCHNPESISVKKALVYNDNICIGCDKCGRKDLYDLQGLESCHIDKCPTGALDVIGEYYTVDEMMEAVLKDKIFYDQSHGGVTFSGGEPLMQNKFLLDLLMKCKENGLQVALDTSGYAPWSVVEAIMPLVDLFLYDLKLIDDDLHRKYTGVSNELILENLKKLSSHNKRIFIRLPLIPGVNDSMALINATCDFLKDLNIEQVNLLPFHQTAIKKYENIQSKYKLSKLQSPSEEKIDALKKIIEGHGIKTVVGG